MVDAHVHLDKYGGVLPKALEQIRTLSIHTLAVSMDVESFRKTQQLVEVEPLIPPSFGKQLATLIPADRILTETDNSGGGGG